MSCENSISKPMAANIPPTLLTLPCELRNAIYELVFARTLPLTDAVVLTNKKISSSDDHPLAVALQLSRERQPLSYPDPAASTTHLRILQTCRQIHQEASQLALSHTTFHVDGEAAKPENFAAATRALSFAQQGSLRHVTLTGKIAHLRALNETWAGLPFGHAGLDLDVLTIIPRKVNATGLVYEEVADISQSHTLAYILAETTKRLRNVRVVQVCNQGCFNEVVWRLVYRSLVYRMWRWGGEKCGVRFECGQGEEEKKWFCIWLRGESEEAGHEVGDEVVRLVGGPEHVPQRGPADW